MSGAIPERRILLHHAALFGLGPPGREGATGGWWLALRPTGGDAPAAWRRATGGGVVAAVLPSREFCAFLGVEAIDERAVSPPASVGARLWSRLRGSRSAGDVDGRAEQARVLTCTIAGQRPWRRLRTFGPVGLFGHPDGQPVVCAADGAAAWLWVPVGLGGILLVGTEIAADLVRYRQGDPSLAAMRQQGGIWGYGNERPLYLYDEQLKGEDPHERNADWWAMALAQAIAERTGRPLDPILPGGAAGAIVLTGDDDQAPLHCYRRQLSLVDGLPITYFLHPLTKHTRDSIREMSSGRTIEFGLHPDALDAPERYAELLAAQAAWFEEKLGYPPSAVRNHGYLNDGYWGHLPAWLRAGVQISSNIPGLDGRVLNGSLLPARVAWEGTLTEHWSLLTAIGDGVLFALGMDEAASAECVLSCGRRIRESGVPGVVVLNLHPENVEKARAMHLAALQLVQEGFLPWTLGECLDWFKARDHSGEGQ